LAGLSLFLLPPAIASQNGKDAGSPIVRPALPPTNNFIPAIQGKVLPALPKPELPDLYELQQEVKPAYPEEETPRHHRMFSPLNNALANQPGHFVSHPIVVSIRIVWYTANMTWILIAIVVLILLWLVLAYNGLITSRNRTQEAFSDIDVQLKRRYDLIPNLVESVKGYAAHEKTVFEDVTKARSNAMQATGPAKAGAENQLSGALKSLFAVAENYPDLKANQNFLSLQNELTDTEDKIQAARRFYNGMVRDFNTKLQVFPTNIFANMMGFTKMDFFGNDLTDAEKQPVSVKF
jgi:LemA protein